jgi:hypothetical protein
MESSSQFPLARTARKCHRRRGDDNTARPWDAATGKALAVLKGQTDFVRAVAFDPSGEMLLPGHARRNAGFSLPASTERVKSLA